MVAGKTVFSSALILPMLSLIFNKNGLGLTQFLLFLWGMMSDVFKTKVRPMDFQGKISRQYSAAI